MAAKNLKLFTFIYGQEVIAEVVHEIDPTYPDAFVIKGAKAVQLIPQRDGVSYGIGFLPLSGINVNGEHRVFNRAVASECINIPEDMVNAYIKQTSGIEVISSASLIQLQ